MSSHNSNQPSDDQPGGRLAWRALCWAASAAVVAGVIVQLVVSMRRAVTPVDVSGTLFGGAMSAPMDIAACLVSLIGVLVVALLRLPGFRWAWIAGGGFPLLFGGLALWRYPDDYGGNLIFSPTRSELQLVMILGAAFLGIGAVLRQYDIVPRLRLSRLVRSLVVSAMAVLFLGAPLFHEIAVRQSALSACVHDC